MILLEVCTKCNILVTYTMSTVSQLCVIVSNLSTIVIQIQVNVILRISF